MLSLLEALALAALCVGVGFGRVPASRAQGEASVPPMWRSIEVRWAGRSHTLVLRRELRDVTTLVTEALGMSLLDF